MPVIAPLFFLAALVYASVGFAGGSTYTAILSIADIDYRIIPVVSCAATSSCLRVVAGVLRKRWACYSGGGLFPWVALSVPMAFLAVYCPSAKSFFFGVLHAHHSSGRIEPSYRKKCR